jgi:hypothetical protein
MFICQHCDKECKNKNSHSNHERRCPKNINRNYISYTLGKPSWNKGLTKENSTSLAKASDTMKKRGHGGWSKDASSKGGKAGGGYRENAGRSKKFKVIDSFGRETTLQSTYELRCSEILKNLGFKWFRPKALKYDGKNYFADFYLPDYNIWLDPKNDYKAKQDEEKIHKVIKQNNVKLFVILNHQLTEEYIRRLAEMD